jgi:hypothetical protein
MPPKCSLIKEQINKTWQRYTVTYYLAFKKKELSTCAVAWTNPKDILLSEISQSQKDACCMVLLLRGSLRKFMEAEIRMVARGWGKREMRTQCLLSKAF